MGILAEFFVSTEADAARYDETTRYPQTHCALYKRLTEVELTTLYQIAQGLKVDDSTRYAFKNIRVVDGGEQLTTEVLPDLVARLAGASDAELASWADLWGETEEIGCPGADILPVVEDLRRLSRVSVAEGKGLFLWNCV